MNQPKSSKTQKKPTTFVMCPLAPSFYNQHLSMWKSSRANPSLKATTSKKEPRARKNEEESNGKMTKQEERDQSGHDPW